MLTAITHLPYHEFYNLYGHESEYLFPGQKLHKDKATVDIFNMDILTD